MDIKNIILKTKKLDNHLISDIKYKYKKNLSLEDYLWLTTRCMVCEINEPSIIEIHHINKNRNDNGKNNLIGLCPNCHKLTHLGKISISSDGCNKFINIKKVVD
jgi:hypothetical protein